MPSNVLRVRERCEIIQTGSSGRKADKASNDSGRGRLNIKIKNTINSLFWVYGRRMPHKPPLCRHAGHSPNAFSNLCQSSFFPGKPKRSQQGFSGKYLVKIPARASFREWLSHSKRSRGGTGGFRPRYQGRQLQVYYPTGPTRAPIGCGFLSAKSCRLEQRRRPLPPAKTPAMVRAQTLTIL